MVESALAVYPAVWWWGLGGKCSLTAILISLPELETLYHIELCFVGNLVLAANGLFFGIYPQTGCQLEPVERYVQSEAICKLRKRGDLIVERKIVKYPFNNFFYL
jgi:hypothetical protein